MPRKRQSGSSRRESSSNRWKRNRASVARLQVATEDGRNPNHQRIDLDSLEFASLFTVVGGKDCIGPGLVRAFDRHGRNPGDAVAPKILDMDRGTVAVLAQQWVNVEAIRIAREQLSMEGEARQVNRLLSAVERDSFGWYRQEVPDQKLRSVLVGSSGDTDPTVRSDGLVVCFKGDDNRYHVSVETWDGGWSTPNVDGFRERVGVRQDPLTVSAERKDGSAVEVEITFHNEHEAQAAIIFAAKAGELEEFADRKDATHMHRIAKRLRVWEHQGEDRKEIFG